MSRGYWNRPHETTTNFHAFLEDTGEGPFLRTGDLGFLQDGQLFITGRLKDLIIIRGQNHHPEDIEQTVERCHAAIRPACCAAFSVDLDGEERLIVAAEVDHHRGPLSTGATFPEADVVKRAIVQAVAEVHDIRASTILLLEPRTIPKTASGKIQRHVCCRDFVSGNLHLV